MATFNPIAWIPSSAPTNVWDGADNWCLATDLRIFGHARIGTVGIACSEDIGPRTEQTLEPTEDPVVGRTSRPLAQSSSGSVDIDTIFLDRSTILTRKYSHVERAAIDAPRSLYSSFFSHEGYFVWRSHMFLSRPFTTTIFSVPVLPCMLR
jgi:hypothetical protein